MEQKYNVYFAGHLQEGQDPATVKAEIGRLFKADAATLEKLFSGTPQLLKKACDKTTALKFKQAIERAGAKPIIKTVTEAGEPPPAAEPTQEASAAERIAALASAPDMEGYRQTSAEASAAADDDALASVDPAGADVLRPEERTVVEAREVDTSGISLTEAGGNLSDPAPAPPPAPDTDHLSMGEVGDDIPTLPDERTLLDPDISALDLSPEGTDFSDCAAPEPEAPDLDLSALDLAEAGSDVLEETYRRKDTTEAPSTDHLSLEN